VVEHISFSISTSLPCPEDLKEASLLLVNDINAIGRKYQAVAALFGRVIMSSAILQGGAGVKLSYQRGVDHPVFVYVTDNFKATEPGLTLILREACGQGWKAVAMDELTRRSQAFRNVALLLKGRHEEMQPMRRSRILKMDGCEFVAWVSKKFLKVDASAWVKESE